MALTDPIQHSYESTYRDLVAAQTEGCGRVVTRWERWSSVVWLAVWSGVVAFVIRILEPILVQYRDQFSFDLSIGLIVLAIAAYIFVVVPWTGASLAAGISKRVPMEATLVSLSTDSLIWRTENTTTELRWPGVEKAFVTTDVVGFVARLHVYFVPRRIFANDAELKVFLAQALSHMTPVARAESEKDRALKTLLG